MKKAFEAPGERQPDFEIEASPSDKTGGTQHPGII
jgi:hypothetical protein